jgi:hypothetical protein
MRWRPQGAPAPLGKGAPPASAALAWVCRGTQGLPPIATLEGIVAALAD